MDRTVRTVKDVLALLDGLFASESEADRLATGDGKGFWDRVRGGDAGVLGPPEGGCGHIQALAGLARVVFGSSYEITSRSSLEAADRT
ncbi:hypothetical protein [Streptomyces sp. NPDC127190]|uniref:hypothetical protein n=1 Tax=unclassified Streptomyces TaxID=2593676 RepID=UPI0036391AD0